MVANNTNRVSPTSVVSLPANVPVSSSRSALTPTTSPSYKTTLTVPSLSVWRRAWAMSLTFSGRHSRCTRAWPRREPWRLMAGSRPVPLLSVECWQLSFFFFLFSFKRKRCKWVILVVVSFGVGLARAVFWWRHYILLLLCTFCGTWSVFYM